MDSIEHITRLVAMPDSERVRDAEAYLSSHPVTKEEIQEMLLRVRGREPVASTQPLIACVYASSVDGETRANALLCLYHMVPMWESDESIAPSAPTVRAANQLLDQLAQGAANETDEYLRGRKYWLMLRRLIEKKAPPEKTVDAVRAIVGSGEQSSWVWGRILVALQDWPHSSRLFPRDASFPLTIEDGRQAYRVLRKLEDRLESAAVRLVELSQRVPQLLHESTSLPEVYSDLQIAFLRLPGRARAWLFPPEEVGRSLRNADAVGRNRILSIVTADSSAEDLPRLHEYRDTVAGLPRAGASLAREDEWVDAVSLLALEGTIWNLSPTDDRETAVELLERTLALLSEEIPGPFASSANTHRIYQMLGHLANALAAALGKSVNEPDIAGFIPKLIHSPHPFIRLVGANLALIVVRSGGDLSAYVADLLTELERDPVTSDGLARGKDIDEDEYAVMDGVQKLMPPGSENRSGDAFFSVEGFSALLESCQARMIAWRLAATLALLSGKLDDSSLRQRLLALKDQNDVIDGIATEPLPENEGRTVSPSSMLRMMATNQPQPPAGQRGTRWDESAVETLSTPDRSTEGEASLVDPAQPGPLPVSEAERALTELLDVPSSGRGAWAEEFAQCLSESLRTQHQKALEETMKRIWENDRPSGEPESFRSIVASLYRLGYHPLAICEGPFPGHPGAIDDEEYGLESIAYYRSASCMTRDRRHQWGVFIRVHRFLRLVRKLDVPLRALFEPVHIHELFHHFVEEKKVELDLELPCDRFSALEEASANWYALDHLSQMKTDGRIEPDQFERIRNALFKPRSHGGMPGYGDYPALDRQAAVFVPRLLSQQPEVLPAGYRHSRELLEHSHAVNAQRETRHWASLLVDLATGEVPVYLDFLQ